MFISHAQNFEDVMLWRALKHVENGVYIDVGAQHPVIDSVSLAFYEHGWRGVHVEPASHYANLLREKRPDEIVVQAAIGVDRGMVIFFEIPDTGLSTADSFIAKRHREAGFQIRESLVPCITLDEVFSSIKSKVVHWLKIDVEGFERQVLEGWLSSALKPWVVVIESTLPNTQIETHHIWEQLIVGKGYQFAYFDGLSRFYVSFEHPQLLKLFHSGPNYFDGFQLTEKSQFCVLLRNKIQTHESLVEQATTEVQRLNFVVFEANSWGQELSSKVVLGQAEVQHLSQTLATREQELGAQVAQEQNELAEACARLVVQSEELTASQARAQWLENEWDAAKIKIDELNHLCHHWWTMADGVNRELQAVYASRSWRLTVPLRETALLVKQSKHKINTGVAMIFSTPRRMACFTLRHALAYVNNHPKVKVGAIKLLAHFPFLKAYFKAIALANTKMPMSIASLRHPIGVSQIDSHLTPSARRIYSDLKAVIEKNREAR